MRNTGRTASRRLLRALLVVTLAFAGIGVFAGTAQAQPTITVDPNTQLTDGQLVTVTGTGIDPNLVGLVGVVQCGNADSNGTPLPGTGPNPDGSDCFGAQNIGPPPASGTLLVEVDPSTGTATTQYAVHEQGIGANNRQCIETGKNFDCLIVIADAGTQGQALRISAPICFGEGCTVGAAPAGVFNPGALPTTTPAGPEEEAAPPAPAVTARPSFTG
jgi:hypothetical protein